MRTGIVRKCMSALALAGAILLLLPPRADALLQAAASIDGGATLLACDNNVCAGGAVPTFLDLDPTVGILTTGPAVVGDISFSFAVQTSEKSSGPGGLNTLSSAGTVVTNTGDVNHLILLTISDTDFVGPATEFTVTGSGTWVDPTLPATFGGTTITMQWFNDPANQQGAESPLDRPGNLINTANDIPQDGISNQSFGAPGTAFNVSGALAVPDGALFSMTLGNELVLGPGIRLESRGQAEAKPTDFVGEGCLTHTPGFWGNHPLITDRFLPLPVCGVELDTVLAGSGTATTPPGSTSATEAICSVGNDHKILGPQLTQLVRQCTAALLNVAASASGGGNCPGDFPDLESLLTGCCGPMSVCTGDPVPMLTIQSCIDQLDAFNNSPDTLPPFGPFVSPGPADPSQCQEARNNGIVVIPGP
jgi:hypothetical protein